MKYLEKNGKNPQTSYCMLLEIDTLVRLSTMYSVKPAQTLQPSVKGTLSAALLSMDHPQTRTHHESFTSDNSFKYRSTAWCL